MRRRLHLLDIAREFEPPPSDHTGKLASKLSASNQNINLIRKGIVGLELNQSRSVFSTSKYLNYQTVLVS